MNSTAKRNIDKLFSVSPKRKPAREKSVHEEFAKKGHLLRWFHEREYNELRAMQKAFLAMQQQKGGKQ